MTLPTFMYGTAWKEERTAELTRTALQAGFRAIDTANQRRHYFEAAVGEAVAAAIGEGLVTRDQLFLQTKFTFIDGQDHRLPYDAGADVATQVRQSFDSSLAHLRTGHVDSLILHGPSHGRGLHEADWQAWQAMEALQRSGKARLIGASNVSLEQLQALHGGASVKPAFVQNRCFARTGWDGAVRAFCRANGIAYQGFSLLTANVRELHHPTVVDVVRRVGRPLPAVVFRFAHQVGMIPLTGTSDPQHMREDLAMAEFELSAEDLSAIERCGG
jgi:diketogulonate reductase-like aldo/keto reductase